MIEVTVERPRPDAWERLRTIRLRSLVDAPDAFGTTHAQDLARPLGAWRQRLAVAIEVAATWIARTGELDVGVVTGRALPAPRLSPERHHRHPARTP